MDSDGVDSALPHRTVAKNVGGNETRNEVARLTSFAVPRDLTLGGLGIRKEKEERLINKKVYTPNLNVTRNKSRNIRINKDIVPHEKKYPENRKYNRRMRERGILIQANGLFSNGAGIEYIKKSSRFNRSSTAKVSSDCVEIPKASINNTDRKYDVITENESIREVLEDKFVDDLDKNDGLEYVPLKLAEVENEFYMERLGTYLKQEVKLSPPSLYIDHFFNVTQSNLFIMQLPDYLPCENILNSNFNTIIEEADSRIGKSYFTKNTAIELEEGLIGKLQKYKSGKCKLTLGNIRLNLEIGMDSGFLQDIVSMTIETEERSGDVVTLGPVEAKFIAIPDWEDIFAD